MENMQRPTPPELLSDIQNDDKRLGKLKIFFGYAAGVGKTYAMLDEAHEQMQRGVDVLVGYVEPHTRPETLHLLEGLPSIPSRIVKYRDIELREFDLDTVLERKPELVLVDELAHSNAEGMRNKKRYQDIDELLHAGIDVYTTVNVQHLESLNDIVRDITHIRVQETVPDFVFDRADSVKLIDIDPAELLERFSEGKIYRLERAEKALKHFFTQDNLRALREIAMRRVAARLSNEGRSTIAGKNTLQSVEPRFLVCVSSSPTAAKCIRWTARAAEAFQSSWVALYVENTDEEITDEDKKQLNKNLELAERLGADTVELNGYNVVDTIAEYVQMTGVTNVVVGKSNHKSIWKRLFFEKEFEDKLIQKQPNLEIHIITGQSDTLRRRKKKPINWENQKVRFSIADVIKTVVLLALATAVSILLDRTGLGETNVVMVYIVAVILVSRITPGYGYGTVAAVASVLFYDYYFNKPSFHFNAFHTGFPITFLIMLLITVLTSALTVRIKRQAKVAVAKERRTEILYEINKKLLVTRGIDNIASLVNEFVTHIYQRSTIFYAGEPADGANRFFLQQENDQDSSFMLDQDELAVAHWTYVNGKNAGTGTDTLMGAGAFYISITSQGKVLGVIGVSCKKDKLDQEQRAFLQLIVFQVALALERQQLSDEQRFAAVESEKEKMKSNLLRAISHDIRTPLTGILGASSALMDNADKLDEQTKRELLFNIREESQWLIRMVENLLSVTHINESDAHISKTLEAAEEVVSAAINRMNRRFPQRQFHAKVPDALLMIPMDGTLIVQVLINLMENAVKHSPENSVIEIDVQKKQDEAVFAVLDEGEGLSEKDCDALVRGESPRLENPDSKTGMGIGLLICNTIIKAHGGKFNASNRLEGGAKFQFSLPIEEAKS